MTESSIQDKNMFSKYFKILMGAMLCSIVIGIAFVSNNNFRDWIRQSDLYWMCADNVATPLLRKLDPELAHTTSIKIVKNNFAPLNKHVDPEILKTKVWSLAFNNPIGIAAGFDKQAEAIPGLMQMGFGFVEVGGVTPQPQIGNDKPRMFRLVEDSAVINRYGLNSEGESIVNARLAKFKSSKIKGIVGVNIAKNTTSNNALADYKQGVQQLGKNVDFIVLNVSCPNVAWTKNLTAQNDELASLVCAIRDERDQLSNPNVPLLMKLGPDMTDATKEHMAEIAVKCKVDGLVVANTSSERTLDLQSKYSKEMGGLSGKPIKYIALQSVRDMYRLTKGQIPIIGVGGIESGQDAYARIRAGASLIQIYTGLVYQGPGLIIKIKRELADLLTRDGFTNISQAVGIDTKIGD